MIQLHLKSYDGESLYDLQRDVAEAIDSTFNEEVKQIPVDKHGFQQGKFVVSITWFEDDYE